MKLLLRILVLDFGWIHLSLGLLGNIAFFVGSVLFLPRYEAWQTTGVWLFIWGSGFMLIGALGQLLVKIFEREDRRLQQHANAPGSDLA